MHYTIRKLFPFAQIIQIIRPSDPILSKLQCLHAVMQTHLLCKCYVREENVKIIKLLFLFLYYRSWKIHLSCSRFFAVLWLVVDITILANSLARTCLARPSYCSLACCLSVVVNR